LSLTDGVSWEILRQIIMDSLGRSVAITSVRPLNGGSMSTALLIHIADRPPVVLKIAPHMVMQQYGHEAYQLNLLRDWGLPVPRVFECQIANLDSPHSYLLMEQMPGRTLAEVRGSLSADDFDRVEMHLADLVLSIHARTNVSYKRVHDGGEDGTRNFVEFFHRIYDPIIDDVLGMKLVDAPLRRRLARIHSRVSPLLEHDDRPRLLHGDLWSSNLLVDQDRQGRWWISAILDPNCRYSHTEIELAYLELFKTVTPAFFRVYEQTQRLTPEYHAYRRDIYMLYSLLNHVRLFGRQYAKPLSAMAERVSGHLRRAKPRSGAGATLAE